MTEEKTIYADQKGIALYLYKKTPEGKYTLFDIGFGDTSEAIADLRGQGFKVVMVKFVDKKKKDLKKVI